MQGNDLALAAAALALLVFLYGLRPLARWRLRHIPGPAPQWLVGNGRAYLSGKRIYAYPEAAKRYGKVFKVWLGAQPTVIIHDAEIGRVALLRNQVRGKVGGPSQFTFSPEKLARTRTGLFNTQDKALHKALKHAWMPASNSASLAENAGLMETSVARLAELLEEPAQAGQAVNIWRMYGDMTLDVVGTAAFGVEFQTQAKGGHDAATQELVDAVQGVFEHSGDGSTVYSQLVKMLPSLRPLIVLLSVLLPDRGLAEARVAFENMDRVVKEIVRDARSKAGQGVDVHIDAGAAPGGGAKPAKGARKPRGVKPGSFPTMMVAERDPRTGRPLDDVIVASQIQTFLLAGYETTATTLGYTTYCLASNPAKLAKLCQEVDAHAKGGEVSVADALQLPYLEACYKEAMRLFAPVVSVARVTDDEQTLGGFRIPPGTDLVVPMFSIQRDAAAWKDPEAYLPERWIEGSPEWQAPTPGAWMPFGEGTRICAGQRFALQEIKITLARLLTRYTFKLAPGQEDLAAHLHAGITLTPDSGAISVVPVRR